MLHSAPTNAGRPAWRLRGNPVHWEPVLRQYPELRLNFAHFGGAFGAVPDPEDPVGNSWAFKIIDLMGRYPNVYADFADFEAVIAYTSSQRREYQVLLQLLSSIEAAGNGAALRQRIMFGTDWEMLERTPAYGTFPSRMLSMMQQHLKGSIDDYAAGNAGRFIGLAEDNSGAVSRLTRFHAPQSPGRQVVDEFRAIAKGQKLQALAW